MTDRLPPLARLKWIPRTRLSANAWNPNRVAPTELDLLVTSLTENGWTQPIVGRPVDLTGDSDDLEIVDGFHRWTVSDRDEVAALTDGMRPGENPTERESELTKALLDLLDALDSDAGAMAHEQREDARQLLDRYDKEDAEHAGEILIPVVTLEGADVPTLMMATIRHNRARGAHHVLKMADIVAELAGAGVADEEICRRVGMDIEEVVRLKQRGKMTVRAANPDGTLGKAWHAEMKDDTETG